MFLKVLKDSGTASWCRSFQLHTALTVNKGHYTVKFRSNHNTLQVRTCMFEFSTLGAAVKAVVTH